MNFDKFLPLALEDSIHDFWKERKTKKTESDDDDEIDDLKMEALHTFLVYKGRDLLKNPGLTNIQSVLGVLTQNEVKSATSEYERSIEHYYETKSNFKSELFYATKERITYGEIIRDADFWNTQPKQTRGVLPHLWLNYNAKNGVQNVLDIYFGNDPDYPSFGIVQSRGKEGVIGNFILNYMFPGFNLENPEKKAYLTFDANAGLIGKIFRKFTNIFNLITPANIGDSASTDFNALENRNIYQFPKTDGEEYVFDSNYYTRRDNPSANKQPVIIKFIDNGFGYNNPYGFTLNINVVGGLEAKFPFSSTQKQGPSVNYLSGLMIDKSTIPKKKKSTILNMNEGLLSLFEPGDTIHKYPSITTDLCMDLKRGGDYEQVNSAANLTRTGMTVIMVTIDTLCSLYSRLLAQPTIHHVSTTGLITLSRFSAPRGDPEEMERANLHYRSITNTNKLVIMERMFTPKLLAVYDRYYHIFNIFLQNGQFIDKTMIKKNHAPTHIEQILLALIKIKCIDILSDLIEIKNFLSDLNSKTNIMNEITEFKATLKLADNKESLIANQIKLMRVNDKLENDNIIDKFKALLNDVFVLTPNQSNELENGTELLDEKYTFYDVNNVFKYTGECKILNFDNKLYAELFVLFSKCDKFIRGRGRNSSNLYDKIGKINYEKQIGTLCETFFDKKGLGEYLRQILIFDVTTIQGMYNEDKIITDWYNQLPIQLNLLIQYQSTQSSGFVAPSGFVSTSSGPGATSGFVAPSGFGAAPSLFGAPAEPWNKAPPSTFGAQPRTGFGAPPIPGWNTKGGSSSTVGNQTGGGGEIILFHELSDLLRKIAGVAAAFVESADPANNNYTNLQGFIDGLYIEPFQTGVITTVNDIRFIWENEIMTLQKKLFMGEQYIYKQTDSELNITNLLTFSYNSSKQKNDRDNSLFDMLYIPDEVTGSIQSRKVRGVESFKDNLSQLIVNSNLPAEIIIILVLTVIDNIMQNDVTNHFRGFKLGKLYKHFNLGDKTNFFDNKQTWSDLGRYFFSYVFAVVNNIPVSIVTSKLFGGRKTKKKKRKNKKKKQTRKKINKKRRKTKRKMKKTRKH